MFRIFVLEEKLTATYEFLQVEHQHIELFDFEQSKFRFIAFTCHTKPSDLCYDIAKGIYPTTFVFTL